MRLRLVVASFLVATVASAQVTLDATPPQHRVSYRSLSVLRLNPLGLIEDARISYRFRLYESESKVFRDNFVAIGVAPSFSPAFVRIGPVIEIQPASFFQVWAQYEVLRYLGGFNFLQSFPSAGANYADTELRARAALPAGDSLKNYSTNGTQLTLGANLQFKVGPVVARSQFRLVRPDYNLREGDRVFYDIFYDVLAPDRGFFFTNDADVLYQRGRLTAGVRWTVTRALYGDEHKAPGERGPFALHRAGPLVAFLITDNPRAQHVFTVLAVVNWWLKHPYRTGVDVSQAMPYFALGLAITGDLLPVHAPAPEKQIQDGAP